MLLMGVAAHSASLPAQTNVVTPAAVIHRCLFIVETSRATQRRIDGTVQAVQELVLSGLNGQLQRGDSIGLWTYNEELFTRQLPAQDWSADAQSEIAARIAAFLKTRKFEKTPRFEKVLPALNGLVEDSRLLTVVLVCSGEQPIQGTPFDDRINTACRLWRDQQQQARMPFVIVLRATDNKLTDVAVSPAPWPAELPPLVRTLPLASAGAKAGAAPASNYVARATNPAPVVPPLIVSGKPSIPTPVPKPVDPVAEVTRPAAIISTGAPPAVLVASAPIPPAAPPVRPIEPPPVAPPAKIEPPPPSAPALTSPPGPIESSPAPKPEPVIVNQVEPVKPAQTDKSAASDKPLATALPTNPAPIQAAAIAPAQSWLPRLGVWIAASVGVLLLAGAIWLWRDRARRRAHVSLITRSLDRERP
jgi:hypothetical protein